MNNEQLAHLLLDWYAEHGRDLPWRVKGGAHFNPYAVMVSEIMLQQTTVQTVKAYFERFMRRFPTVYDLAAATEDEVFQYWQGLGYYSRARSLRQAAQMVCEVYGGKFPQTTEEIAKLKGFGPYTVASFAALAFNLPETVVDGNVMRIMCRMYHLTAPLEEIKEEVCSYAKALTAIWAPADYASAIMDLGAMICTPKKPQCLLCPWQKYCRSAGSEDVEQIPQRHKAQKKEFNGYVCVVRNQKGEVLLRKRTEKGLLHGLYEFPWCEKIDLAKVRDSGLAVTHIFTHIKMTLKIVEMESKEAGDGFFAASTEVEKYPMATLMHKVWKKLNS